MLSDKDLLKKFEKDKQTSERQLDGQHRAAKEAHQFVAGDEMYYNATVEDKGSRREVIFNKVAPYVDAVVGTMIQMRRKPQYNARIMKNPEQREFSEYMNNLSDFAREQAYMDFVETMQDREMLITGYGAVDTGISYESNPDGDIVAECLRFDDVYFDPLARAANMLDGRFVYRKKPFSKEEVEVRFKDVPVEDFDQYTGMKGNAQYYPDGGVYDKIEADGAPEMDLLQVYYYQWWELLTYWRAENPVSQIESPEIRAEVQEILGRMQENRYEVSSPEEQEDLFEFKPDAEYLSLNPDQYGDVKALCKQYGLTLNAVQQRRKCYYTALITGKKVLRKFKSPDQRGFTIKFKTGKYDPTTRLWYGMVRGMMKPAEYANKALTEMLFAIASNSKGGVMYEEDAVEDPRRFEQQWATTKAAIKVQSGALSSGKIEPKAQAALPTGYENILTYANESLPEAAGISREFLGTSQNKQVAALLESQRINQVMATLAVYFDAISLYQIEQARLMITYLRMLAQNSIGRLVRILGRDGTARYEELDEQRMVPEYDVTISEAPTTPAQKQQTTEIMVNLADKLATLGINIYPVIVPFLPIPQKDQQLLVEAMTPGPEDQKAQAEQAAQEKALNQVIMLGTKAKADRDMAEAQRKLAEIPLLSLDADKTKAETAKALEDARQTHLESEILRKNPDVPFKGSVSA